jgi:hypothetical protein
MAQRRRVSAIAAVEDGQIGAMIGQAFHPFLIMPASD